MREGKTPGQITFTIIFFSASFDACILVRWMQAAFEVLMPAMLAIFTTREGLSGVAPCSSSSSSPTVV
ncbi:unnamed protein product [Periconia digitata]|uniref:Uncharacterized protein n=1 Tax=Periconia digitata TaxID=1303443 RepID=A0A9W4US16_9PLEO|nr:unnamed protein product [Periconia digitata]